MQIFIIFKKGREKKNGLGFLESCILEKRSVNVMLYQTNTAKSKKKSEIEKEAQFFIGKMREATIAEQNLFKRILTRFLFRLELIFGIVIKFSKKKEGIFAFLFL